MMSKTLALVVAFAASVSAAAPFVLNTPSGAAQCVPTLITWEGGQGPFFLVIQSGDDRVPVEDIANLAADSTSFTWETNLPAGTLCGLELTDATGAVAESGLFTIGSGNDDCTLV